ncbi:hypothetical protein ACGFNU_28765 [Spirillospora sp. NPDC048911]
MTTKVKIKLAVIAALTALIAGALLATGPDEAKAAAFQSSGSVR